jgi:hypothetical protein
VIKRTALGATARKTNLDHKLRAPECRMPARRAREAGAVKPDIVMEVLEIGRDLGGGTAKREA